MGTLAEKLPATQAGLVMIAGLATWALYESYSAIKSPLILIVLILCVFVVWMFVIVLIYRLSQSASAAASKEVRLEQQVNQAVPPLPSVGEYRQRIVEATNPPARKRAKVE